MLRRQLILLAVVSLMVAVPRTASAAPAPEPEHLAAHGQALAGAPTCGPSRADPNAPQNGRNDTGRIPSPIYFAPDFPVFADSDPNPQLGAVGGFGGIRFRAPLHHTPVVFVHGNQADAQNWLDPMMQFAHLAGYTMQEMYALSYNGLANYYAGAPVQLPPTALDQAYIEQNDMTLATAGKGAGNEDNVPDLCRFVEAVQWYTGSAQVDIVAHSLGVTITRRMMQVYPTLARDVVAFVGIAGANHGTTVCRGQSSSYYGCNEIAPGSEWLAKLNAHGETYAPTHWMTVSNGAEGDPFFVGPDIPSPRLAGADNRTFNAMGVHGDYHNDLRVDKPEVETYLAFLLRSGQGGVGAATRTSALAAQIDAMAQQDEASNQTVPSIYQLASAPLCIPGLTGTQDGCALPGGAGSGPPLVDASGHGGNGGGAGNAAMSLPNTAAGGAGMAGSGVLAALLGIAAAVASRRRRQRMAVS